MRNILSIITRELQSYFGSPWSYIITSAFLVVAGYGFGWSSVTYLETSIQGFLGWASFFLLFLGPALTMRLLAEEEKMGTLELLMTSPVRDFEVVLGKFLAALSMLSIMLFITLFYPLILAWFGDPDWGPVISGYLGIFLLGAIFLSIGLFASSLTSNQIVAYVVGSVILLSLWFIGDAAVIGESGWGGILRSISISTHFPAFSRGIIDSNTVVYYISIVLVFLFLTIRSLETRRWR
jgi:ABC-2 type transport system permease protein